MALNYSRLGGDAANFQQMIQRFGVVTVMNAKVYDTSIVMGDDEFRDVTADTGDIGSARAIIAKFEAAGDYASGLLCKLDTLKIANVTEEGPTKTVTGGQYSNPLIKFGKSARLEMQDALGSARALDALCGTISETLVKDDYETVFAVHSGEDFNGPRTIIGDTFFIDQRTGQQVKATIIFYQFLPDSIFNLTQDAEGDATVFDMNGDLMTTVIKIADHNGSPVEHGVFYSIVDTDESDDSSN